MLVLLEDLQWADASSLHLLRFLARQAGAPSLVLIGTYNDSDRDRSPQLVKTERSLLSLGAAEALRLTPLSREQVTELVCRTFSVDAGQVGEFSAMLFGWTQGNAFFLEEIIKALVANGRISSKQGVWIGWDAEDFRLPRTIRDAVLGRIETFSDDAQTVAELAAIIGTRASYPLLAAISGLPEAALLSALEELCAHVVLTERAEAGTVVYDFAHPLVQQTLYGEFGLQRARVLHGAVAEAMEAYYGSSSMDHADELAFHFARTDQGNLRGRAARYLAAAGQRALERRADREAVNYLRSALERTDAQDTGGPMRADIVPHLARAHQHLGEFEAAVELWTDTLAELPLDHPKHSAIRRALGMAHLWCGRHSDAQEHLDIGLERAQALGDQAEFVRLTIAKGHLLNESGKGTEAIETVSLALPIAEELGSAHLLARVHRALALLHVWVGPSHKTREHATRAIELAREVGDLSIEFWARWALAVLSGMSGATEEMAAAIDELNDLANRWRSPVLRLWSADMAIELAWGRGDWDEGIALGEQAITLARNLNQRTLLPRLLVWTSLFHVGRGELEQAQALVDEAADVSGLGSDEGPIDVHQVVPAYIGMAHYLLGLGEYQQAIEAAENGLRIAEGTEYVLWAIHRVLPVLGEACLWAARGDRPSRGRQRPHAGARAEARPQARLLLGRRDRRAGVLEAGRFEVGDRPDASGSGSPRGDPDGSGRCPYPATARRPLGRDRPPRGFGGGTQARLRHISEARGRAGVGEGENPVPRDRPSATPQRRRRGGRRTHRP